MGGSTEIAWIRPGIDFPNTTQGERRGDAVKTAGDVVAAATNGQTAVIGQAVEDHYGDKGTKHTYGSW